MSIVHSGVRGTAFRIRNTPQLRSGEDVDGALLVDVLSQLALDCHTNPNPPDHALRMIGIQRLYDEGLIPLDYVVVVSAAQPEKAYFSTMKPAGGMDITLARRFVYDIAANMSFPDEKLPNVAIGKGERLVSIRYLLMAIGCDDSDSACARRMDAHAEKLIEADMLALLADGPI